VLELLRQREIYASNGAPGRHQVPRRLRGAAQGSHRRPGEKPEAILFIDEIHTVWRWCHQRRLLDASNILAVPLRGMRCIGSTTSKNTKTFEKDQHSPAASRK
jgi:ATP-dependent Clp protease ATP-binding subunit ClpA